MEGNRSWYDRAIRSAASRRLSGLREERYGLLAPERSPASSINIVLFSASCKMHEVLSPVKL